LLRSVINRLLLGTAIPEEYGCVARETLERRSRVLLSGRHTETFVEVGDRVIFVGYKPLVMAIHFPVGSSESEWLHRQQRVCLSYGPDPDPPSTRWNGHITFRGAIARLILRRVSERRVGASEVSIWQGELGSHDFLSRFHQTTNRWRDYWAPERPGNVRLPGNLHDQVRIAYSVPIGISIVTLNDGPLMNMFPTDLHGPVGDGHYVSSLRCGSQATEQLERLGSAAISEVEAPWYKQAYALGKNHIRVLRPLEEFPLSTTVSAGREIPLPSGMVAYRELERLESIDVGIHRIHFYRSGPVEQVAPTPTLAHLHRFYLQWRRDRGLPTQILQR
jgi:hypothetical protein